MHVITDIRFFKYYVFMVLFGYLFFGAYPSEYTSNPWIHVLHWWVTFVGTFVWYHFKLSNERYNKLWYMIVENRSHIEDLKGNNYDEYDDND